MIVEARIYIELPDVNHEDNHISEVVAFEFMSGILDDENPFCNCEKKRVSASWEYEDVNPKLIEAK